MLRLISAILLVVVAWSGATVADQFLRSDATFQTALTGANGTLTNAMLADMAQATVKGRASGAGTGAPTDLSQAQLTALCSAFTTSLSGCVASSGGGTANFLRADGSWAAPPDVSGRVLLNTLTASSSTTLSDTTSFTSTYDIYELEFIHVVPTTDAKTMQLQVHTGGSFPATNYVTTVIDQVNGGGMAGNTTNTTALQLSNTNGLLNAAPGVSGRITFYNPSITTAVKAIGGLVYSNNTGGTFASQFFMTGYWNGGNGAVDGFQVFSGTLNTNTIASGKIKVYGVN